MSEDCNFDIIPGNYLEIYSIAKALCLHYKMHLYNGPIVATYMEFTREGMLDDFESLYKGEISKSGTPMLPSKRARKAPEKIQVSKEDLAELSQTAQPDVDTPTSEDTESEQGDVSLEEVSESESQESDFVADDSEPSNT